MLGFGEMVDREYKMCFFIILLVLWVFIGTLYLAWAAFANETGFFFFFFWYSGYMDKISLCRFNKHQTRLTSAVRVDLDYSTYLGAYIWPIKEE